MSTASALGNAFFDEPHGFAILAYPLMEFKETNIDDSIILAYLNSEELTHEQREAVEQWLQDESNCEKAKSIMRAWELSCLFSNKSFDVSKALSAVKSRVHLSKKAT